MTGTRRRRRRRAASRRDSLAPADHRGWLLTGLAQWTVGPDCRQSRGMRQRDSGDTSNSVTRDS